MQVYKKATVLRTNPVHVAKLGAPAFDGLFCKWSGDSEIISYFARKMFDEGYQVNEFSISLVNVTIDPATGKACEVA
jgi:hypothetical protein